MKLHKDKDAFSALIGQISTSTGYRADVIEKDYYVVLMLKELAEKQSQGLAAYFKGGTALYKALKSIRRFSEDIDVSVDTRGLSRSQDDRRLEQAAKRYTCLERDGSLGRTDRSSVIAVYRYTPVVEYDADDALQRFERVQIEATSFTISEPFEKLEISPLLFDQATTEQKQILMNHFDVFPFSVLTMTMERIFIDKLFAAEAYTLGSEKSRQAFDAAKHIYDLAVLAGLPKIQSFMKNKDAMQKLLDIRAKEELQRRDGIPGIAPRDFVFFTKAGDNTYIHKAYEIMQNQYVFHRSDRITFNQATDILLKIEEQLKNNPAWMLEIYNKHYKSIGTGEN